MHSLLMAVSVAMTVPAAEDAPDAAPARTYAMKVAADAASSHGVETFTPRGAGAVAYKSPNKPQQKNIKTAIKTSPIKTNKAVKPPASSHKAPPK